MSRFSQPTRRIRVNLVLSLALLFLSSNALAATDQAKRLITVDDKFAFQSVASPVFSPDGKWIAYTVRTRNFAENSSTQRIWLIPTKGGAAIPMTSALVSSGQPVFSRDGSLLYFLSTRGDQKSQVWSLNLRSGGEGQQVTRLERGINQINFSPDEKKLLLVLKDEDKSEPLVEGSKPWVVNRLDFKKDYQGYVGNLRSHIYVYDIATNQLSQVTSGDFDDSEPTWSPDGSQVAFTSNRNQKGDENSDIWLVSANGGAEARKITTSKGADSSPTWHPDGKWLAYRAAQSGVEPNYATQHLARIKTDGSGSEFLTEEIDRNINNLQFSETGEHLYFLIEDSGEQHLARMHWKDKKVERLVAGKFVVGAFSVSNSGQLAGIISSLQRPSELFIQREDEPVIVTSVNDELINQLKLASTEEIHFKAPDGWPIEGFVTLPPGYKAGQRYPVILKIHGGPVSQYNHGFSYESQILAANGYVVVRSNPRGSSGYGQDFTFGLYQGWGENDYRDVLAAVDHVIEQGYGDPDRLGVGGFSYGGILTNYIIGQTQRFKAAVSGAGSGLYVASYGHDMYRYWYESELGVPWENREMYERLSPFNYIHQATTPTLFMGGEKDWNVPIQGSEQLYQVMKRMGVDTELVVYPDEHHGDWSLANEKDAQLRKLAWFDRYLK